MEREEMRYEANFAAKRLVLADLLSSSARLTTFAGNTRASTPSIRINIVHNYIFVRVYVHTRANWARVITYPRRTMRWICVCHWVLYIFYCYGRERVISFFFVCSSNSMRGAHRCVMINSICDSCVISASNQLFEIMIW